MNRSTLPRHARAHAPGWAHPYPAGPLSPFFYADGGDDQDDDGDGGDDDTDDQDDDAGNGGDSGDGGDGGDDQDDGDGGDDDTDDADPEGADQLGDKGKRALASMKGKWRTERDKRRDLERRLAEKEAGSGGAKDDADTIRRQAEAAATVKANARIIRSEVRAAAVGKLADPKDALTFLDLGQFEVNEDGEVDADEIADAIDDLIKSKPYLAAATGRRFQGTADGGAARKASRPKQLTERDLTTMTPEQIDKAHQEGRFDDLLSGG